MGDLLIPCLIAVVIFCAFLPALRNTFVDWDDDKNFVENPDYRGLGWPQLRWMFTTFHMGHYIPLTWMTLGIDYLVWGMNPGGYHLTNVLFHAANAVLFYFLSRRLLTLAAPGAGPHDQWALSAAAAFAACFFALHPLRVESVAWITERRDVVSGLFYLSAILAYLRAARRPEGRGGWYGLAFLLYGGAVLSKATAVVLPAVLLILDAYPLRRLGGAVGWWGERARRVYAEKIPFVLLAVAISGVAFIALVQLKNMASVAQLGAVGRLAFSAYGLAVYMVKTILPVNLLPLYEGSDVVRPWAPSFLLSYAAVFAITAVAVALRRRIPALLAVWAAYVLTLLPVLGIFQNGPQIVADRYTYLAGMGWAILGAAGLMTWWQAWRRGRRGRALLVVPVGLAGICLALLAFLTWSQVQVWRDTGTLWTYTLSRDPRSSIAHNNLGAWLLANGQLDEATHHFEEALRISPQHAGALVNLGIARALQGNLDEGIERIQRALRIEPGNPVASTHLKAMLRLRDQPRSPSVNPPAESGRPTP